MKARKFLWVTFQITFLLLIKNYWYVRAKNDGWDRYGGISFDVQSREILWKPVGLQGYGRMRGDKNRRRRSSSNIMWRGCATPVSRGCLLLLPVVATIRSKISEPRRVCISSQASYCERGYKDVYYEGREKREQTNRPPRCYSKYLQLYQACNSLNYVKCALFPDSITFIAQDIKSPYFAIKSFLKTFQI
jgi:hypothetical protein